MSRVYSFLTIVIVFVFFWSIPSASADMRALLSSKDKKVDDYFMDLSLNSRLDMMDYFDAGQAIYSHGPGKSEIRISQLGENHVRFESPANVSVDVYLLTPKSDSLLVSVITSPIGNGDSAVRVRNFKNGKDYGMTNPPYSEWLTKDALKNVTQSVLMAEVPFVTATAEFNPEQGTLTFTNTSVKVRGLDKKIADVFKPSLTYIWNGKNLY